MKSLAVVAALILSGCASTDGPVLGSITLKTGESHCTGSKASCDELRKVASSLHTGQLARDIEAARLK